MGVQAKTPDEDSVERSDTPDEDSVERRDQNTTNLGHNFFTTRLIHLSMMSRKVCEISGI